MVTKVALKLVKSTSTEKETVERERGGVFCRCAGYQQSPGPTDKQQSPRCRGRHAQATLALNLEPRTRAREIKQPNIRVQRTSLLSPFPNYNVTLSTFCCSQTFLTQIFPFHPRNRRTLLPRTMSWRKYKPVAMETPVLESCMGCWCILPSNLPRQSVSSFITHWRGFE